MRHQPVLGANPDTVPATTHSTSHTCHHQHLLLVLPPTHVITNTCLPLLILPPTRVIINTYYSFYLPHMSSPTPTSHYSFTNTRVITNTYLPRLPIHILSTHTPSQTVNLTCQNLATHSMRSNALQLIHVHSWCSSPKATFAHCNALQNLATRITHSMRSTMDFVAPNTIHARRSGN
jgi:hypothetical protein